MLDNLLECLFVVRKRFFSIECCCKEKELRQGGNVQVVQMTQSRGLKSRPSIRVNHMQQMVAVMLGKTKMWSWPGIERMFYYLRVNFVFT